MKEALIFENQDHLHGPEKALFERTCAELLQTVPTPGSMSASPGGVTVWYMTTCKSRVLW